MNIIRRNNHIDDNFFNFFRTSRFHQIKYFMTLTSHPDALILLRFNLNTRSLEKIKLINFIFQFLLFFGFYTVIIIN